MKKVILLILSSIILGCSSPGPDSDIIFLKKGWKIKKGDEAAWADPLYDDSEWIPIIPGKAWESMNIEQFADYNGYAWYRITFQLPEDIRKLSYFGEKLQITLGNIDDTEQTYLNGSLLGVNNKLVLKNDGNPGKFEGDTIASTYFRNYLIPVEDERIIWDDKNVLSIRVHDQGGSGGMLFPSPSISMVDIKDFFYIDIYSDPFEISGNHFIKNIKLNNQHKSEDFFGELMIKVSRHTNGKVVYETREEIEVKASGQNDFLFSFSVPTGESYKIEYIFKIEGSLYPIYESQSAPYVRTLPASD